MKNEHEIMSYIKNHPVAVLSTSDDSRKLYGAAVYLCAISADQVYFVTKTETQKFRNIQENPEVAVTIVDPDENSSLQARGHTTIIKDPSLIELIMGKMATIYAQGADWLPPLAKIRAGAYQIVGIKLNYARLAHFKDAHPGDAHIFKEL